MTKHPFSGTGVAIVTPFLENGDIDQSGIEKLVEHLINGKVDYLVALGTTGENATLNKEEKQLVFTLVNKFNMGRVKLVAGIGGNDTRAVIEAFSAFDLTGYSAILSVSPYYNKPNAEGIFQHYKALDKCGIPLFIYNVPGRSVINISDENLARISELKNVAGIKAVLSRFLDFNSAAENSPLLVNNYDWMRM